MAHQEVTQDFPNAGAHTPGPWKKGSCDSSVIWARSFRTIAWKDCPEDIERGEGVAVASIDDPIWAHQERLDFDESLDAWEAEVAANKNLIAAAPDLLDALKRLIEPAPGVARLPAWVYGIVRPAIAKAEGRS
jgi:hypothetical protein